MRRITIFLSLLLLIDITAIGKNVKIRITGTLEEPVTMTLGNRTEIIYSLPYIFQVDKKELPLTGKFSSGNYTYKNIVFNKNEEDGRIYVLHHEAIANQSFQQAPNKEQAVNPSKASGTFDLSIDVNRIPNVAKKADKTFALVIANENYESAAKVDMALNDGLVFKEYCVKTLGLPDNHVKYYSDVTYGQLTKALKNIQDIADAFDGDINLIVYYAGHGIPDNATKDAYLMPVDADGTDTGVCMSLNKLYQIIDAMNLTQAIVFLDACFSGAQRDGSMVVAARGVALKPKEATPKSNTIVFSATSNEEAAYSYNEKQHGLFSYFLLKNLQESKGNITLGELVENVTKQVKQNSVVINGIAQTPKVIVPQSIVNNWQKLRLSR